MWLFLFLTFIKFIKLKIIKMKYQFFMCICLLVTLNISKAQTTAMQFNGYDCDGDTVDLFADLDSGKAVVLFFYMPNCGSCPPPAQKIQMMTDNINNSYPGMAKGYAFPYQNSTTCSYSSSWVSSGGLSSLFAPMDSGADHVAYYGGFGMPTVVLLGGTDHRVMFSTLSFSTSDTTIMRDSILALVANSSGIHESTFPVTSFSLHPNPSNDLIIVSIKLEEKSYLKVDLLDITGKTIAVLLDEIQDRGNITKEFNLAVLPKGFYLIKLTSNGKSITQKIMLN
jgi:hypothetical protein